MLIYYFKCIVIVLLSIQNPEMLDLAYKSVSIEQFRMLFNNFLWKIIELRVVFITFNWVSLKDLSQQLFILEFRNIHIAVLDFVLVSSQIVIFLFKDQFQDFFIFLWFQNSNQEFLYMNLFQQSQSDFKIISLISLCNIEDNLLEDLISKNCFKMLSLKKSLK